MTGLIGGIGEYFSVDPTVLRIGFVVLVLITGIFPGVIAYIIAYFIVPEKPHAVSTIVTPPPMKNPEDPKPSTSEKETPSATVVEEPIVAEVQKETVEESKPEDTTPTQTQI